MTPGMTAQDLIGVWQRGEVVQYSLTLVEGWNFRQVRSALAKHEKIEQTLDGLSDSEVMAKLGHEGVFPEGRFFPDTYRFVRGMTDAQLLEKAYDRLDKVLAQEWEQRDPAVPYASPYQALIMASLVEKETGVPQERGQIAGVFVRRMKIGMPLQTDPTVIYGLGERYTGKLTRAHLREPTPYNTYTAAKFKDKKQDPATADYLYGLFSVDLKTGKTETTDFGPLTEIYFSGMRSPKDPNLMFGVLNRLAKYDIKQKKLIQAATLDHSYYCISFNKAGCGR